MTAPVRKAKVTATELGSHLDISRQRVKQLVGEGVLTETGGQFDRDASRIAYIRWLRSDERRVSKSRSSSRVQDARAREIELRITERERRVIDVEEAVAALDEIIGPMKAELTGVGARVTRDLDLRGRIEAEHDGIFSRTADRLTERARALRAGRVNLGTRRQGPLSRTLTMYTIGQSAPLAGICVVPAPVGRKEEEAGQRRSYSITRASPAPGFANANPCASRGGPRKAS